MSETFLRAVRRSISFRAKDALGIPIRPLKLRMAITNRCNARCKMCNAWKAEDRSRDEMKLEEYDRLLVNSRVFLSALRHVSITGGEPALRKDFLEIIRLVHRHHPGVSFNVNTNGFLTARLVEAAQAMISERIPATFNVSLDALGEVHDGMRGVPGAARMAMRTLEELESLKGASKDLRIGVNYLIAEENCHECDLVYRYCEEHGFSFNPILPVRGELYDNEEMRFEISREKSGRVATLFEGYIPKNKDKAMAYSEIVRQLRGKPRDFRCWAGQVMLLIEENGDVFPNGGCPREWVFGNLKDYDYRLRDLLQSRQARLVRKQVKRCRACQLSCETLTTLKYPEALAARRKTKALAI